MSGTLYEVEHFDEKKTPFRRHYSKIASRYAVKPYYKPGSKESLPSLPVIYLGLFRLFPYGEFQNDDVVKKINKNLPENYREEIRTIYKDFTGISIDEAIHQSMGDIKKRADFSSDLEGIDSNTISAGEDNLYIIITALVSLKYYFESIESRNLIESILLIDEIDATLHPYFQIKLFNLFLEYSAKYKIQFYFTSHSMTLLEHALEKKANVIYLIDSIDKVISIPDVDYHNIKMYLHNKTRQDFAIPNKIPIFTEDEQAREFWNIIKDNLCERDIDGFSKVSNFFHLVSASIGSNELKNIFNDGQLLRSTIRSICILDGDQHSHVNLRNHIMVFPGSVSPEVLAFEYAKKLFAENSSFWESEVVVSMGCGKIWYREHIAKEIDEIEAEYLRRQEASESKGYRREANKKLFEKYKYFMVLLFKHWVQNPENENQLFKFYKNLHALFCKVSRDHGLNPNDWKKLSSF